LTTREVRRSDLERLMIHRNDWETRRFLEDCREVTMEDQNRWFDTSSMKYRILVRDGVDVGLLRFNASRGDAEVGCDVFKEHRQKGIGTQAMQLALNMARKLDCKSCSLWVFLENLYALAIYSKLGFTVDMNYPCRWYFRGGAIPVPYFRMFKAF